MVANLVALPWAIQRASFHPVLQNSSVREVCYSNQANYAETDDLPENRATMKQEWQESSLPMLCVA